MLRTTRTSKTDVSFIDTDRPKYRARPGPKRSIFDHMVLRAGIKFLALVSALLGNEIALAKSPLFQCHNDQVKISSRCDQLAGLREHLNNTNFSTLELKQEDFELARECAIQVRRMNMDLKSESKKFCAVADDQAFKIITQVGQAEIQSHRAWSSNRREVTDVVFEDKQCFGSVCYRIPNHYHVRYHPNRSQDSGAAR